VKYFRKKKKELGLNEQPQKRRPYFPLKRGEKRADADGIWEENFYLFSGV